jgi:4-methyl-5(b-hydroxyethyl)-thiazole monophosphate biosynthesis
MKRALVLLAPGVEEMEAVIVIDVLRRAGVDTVAAGLEEGVLRASRDVQLLPDLPLSELTDAKDFDLLVLPGGMPGTLALREDLRVRDLLLHYWQAPGARVAAICAAPLVLDAHGLLENRRFTCHPSVTSQIAGGLRKEEAVVVDGNLITSQGPGTAITFALTLVELLVSAELRRELAAGMCVSERVRS